MFSQSIWTLFPFLEKEYTKKWTEVSYDIKKNLLTIIHSVY